jgi:hypothetical protein
MLELSTRVTYFYLDPVGFSADNEMNLQNRRLALRLFFEQDRRSLNPLIRLKVRDYGTPASIAFGRFRIVPHRRELRTISSRIYQLAGEIRTIAARRHTRAIARTVVAVSELLGRDIELGEILGLTAAHRLMA